MNSANTQTVISKDAVFEGKISSKDSVHIDGKLLGDVSSDATIELGSTGIVEGNVAATHVITAGNIRGSVTAKDKVELKGQSRLVGDLVTTRLVIEDGAQFEGMCKMGAKPGSGTVAPAPSAAPAAQTAPEAPTETAEGERTGLFGRRSS